MISTIVTYPLTGRLMDTSFSTPSTDVSQFTQYSYQMNITGGGTNEGSAILEVSVDNVNWTLYPDSTQAVVAADTVKGWEMTVVGHKYVRLSYTATSGAGSSASILLFLKTAI